MWEEWHRGSGDSCWILTGDRSSGEAMAITRSHGDQAAVRLIGLGRWYAAGGQCAIAHGRLLIEKRQPTVSGMAAVAHTDKLQCVTITTDAACLFVGADNSSAQHK